MNNVPADTGKYLRRGGRINFNTAIASACILFAGFLFLIIPSEVERPPTLFGQESEGLDPAFFPELVAIGFLAVGLWYFGSSFRLNDINGFRGLTRLNYLNIGVTTLAFVIYAIILKPIGFIASSALIVAALSIFYGARHWPSIVLVAAGIPTAIYFAFRRLLSVSLPEFPDF